MPAPPAVVTAAAALAGAPIPVLCAPLRMLGAFDGTRILLDTFECHELARFRRGVVGFGTVQAVLVLAHEARHAADPLADETATECAALATVEQAARLLNPRVRLAPVRLLARRAHALVRAVPGYASRACGPEAVSGP